MFNHAKAMMALAVLVIAGAVFPAHGQESEAQANPVDELPWQTGPTQGRIGGNAEIEVPEGYAFLDAKATRTLNELYENPDSGRDEYTFAPAGRDWIAFFSFDDIGYVKDDESIDADEILESIREGTEFSNEERRQRGWEEIHVTGWTFKPQYDKELNALAWAIEAEAGDSGRKIVNFNTRLLGRKGVMEVTLVASPEDLQPAIGQFKALMPGYAFNDGERYADYREGDHIAEYGLAALITGGAAAVATKKGFFAAIGVFLAKAWKLILIGLVAVGAGIRKLFGGKQESNEE
ncbi:hypothetical protein C9I47_2416 [Lysobacter maris]|uniref:DUF2167 domain-containing protein n=2 Tax=Marilutibacter maris TaxID=1605891 RepID=A0A2U9TB42_9GAMM|nr:hypothetical protein C9I47_2416 [Lysobacter maris]